MNHHTLGKDPPTGTGGTSLDEQTKGIVKDKDILHAYTHTYICISRGLGSRETVSDGKLFSTFNMTRMKRSTAEWRRCWCRWRWRRQCQRRTSCDIRRTTYGMQYMVVAWRGMTYRNIHPYINMYTIRIILFPIDSNFNPHKFSLSILKSNCLK